ncbi:MAG: hypothetical protein IPJ35_06620 [Elusimicrobia bacterium]|nr:hypothetical protein [Elusimicrobiota bacterium]
MSWTRAWALALLGVPALLLVLAVATFRWKSRVAAALGAPGSWRVCTTLSPGGFSG